MAVAGPRIWNEEPPCLSAPAFLTVTEAAAVLAIGCTERDPIGVPIEDLATDGEQGLPEVRFGGLVRVPRYRIEQLLGGPISWPVE